ncbi:MAG: adenylosuccinate lyase [marine actinobacterium MedAcidi-G3]|nr:MAG: adenylosuccinate lyase [marine actinobacterium MedAcidi-G3]MBA4813058.1 adenylosuccinate lyase [Acidimicrobiales bacterium]OUW87225.1 MAG: adenylosuccinate lyase [Acidimicrobiaceae bacterium TMED224]HCJ86242.1 adenylosuccinate lyase [Acidimicrobiaceae bacterium]
MPKPTVVNVLATRYASAEMAVIWSAQNKVVLERELWLAVLEAQKDLGIEIDDDAVAAYRSVIADVDLDSIDRRERVTKHDVKARIEEFSSLAGYQHIHKGLTSRDLTENVEQLQIKRSLALTQERLVAVIARLAELAVQYQDTSITGRSHNVPAQMTTLGKRFANLGQETLLAYQRIEDLLTKYPLRGLKGPVGTQQDLLDLFEGDAGKVGELEERVAGQLGFSETLGAVGQIYPRSLDLDVVSALTQTASPLGNIALQVRLMAGLDLATEGFVEGQVGSSAMPHKMNTRSAERVNGFVSILRGHLTMAASISGDQWNEGDVSCSVVRRVVLPDAFFALDGAIETTLTVLEGFGSYDNVIDRELDRYLPFLATTRLLMAAIKAGVGREEAHELIKKHAVAAALEIREGTSGENDLVERLINDPLLPLNKEVISDVLLDHEAFVGLADAQVKEFVASATKINSEHPGAGSYRPSPIL